MGCVIAVTDEPAARAPERELPSLTARHEGTCRRGFAGEPATVWAKGRGSPVLSPRARGTGRSAWLLPRCEMHFSRSSFTAREKADQMPN